MQQARIFAIQGVRLAGEGGEGHFSLARHLSALEQQIRKIDNPRLVIIDPITAYLGETDSHKNAEVRGLLAPLAQLAARHRVAVVAVTHLNKTVGGKALYRAMGSLAFTAAARAVWLVTADKDNPARRLMLPAKMNLTPGATGLAYSIIDGLVAWESDPVHVSADEALAAEMADSGDPGERNEAAEWLRQALADGPLPAEDIWRQAKENRIAERTLKRAKKDLGVEAKREGFGPGGQWTWSLPGHRGSENTIGGQAE